MGKLIDLNKERIKRRPWLSYETTKKSEDLTLEKLQKAFDAIRAQNKEYFYIKPEDFDWT